MGMKNAMRLGVLAGAALAGALACGAEAGDGDTVAGASDDSVGSAKQELRGGDQAFARILADGTVPANNMFNSSGQQIVRVRHSAGLYSVRLHGLGIGPFFDVGGNVQVVAVGSDRVRCMTTHWENDVDRVIVGVRCHSPVLNASGNPTPTDSAFVVHFQRGSTNNGTGAYVRTSDTSNAPALERVWSSSTLQNFVTRTAPGKYTVLLGGVSTVASAAQVTAIGESNGTGANYCKIQESSPAGASHSVRVACFNNAGTATNTRFSLNYFGNAASVGPTNRGAYARAHNPTSAAYLLDPLMARNTGSSATPSCNHQDQAGKAGNIYLLRHNHQQATGGSPHVTAYGTDNIYCKVLDWVNADSHLDVFTQCYTPSGGNGVTQYMETYGMRTGRTGC
jgi:hypothetical protein